jgi:hypothetical protein
MATTDQLSRKERRKAGRQIRKEQLQQVKERRTKTNRVQKLVFYLAGIAILVGAGYWAYGIWAKPNIGDFVPSLGNRHIAQAEVGLITYNSDPPTSGPHLPVIARWGIHDQPILKELQVHNLEDRGVAVQYNCPQDTEECKSLAQKLAEVVKPYDNILLAPYPAMSHKIALTAWTRIDKFNEFDEKRIIRFIESYLGIDHHPRK